MNTQEANRIAAPDPSMTPDFLDYNSKSDSDDESIDIIYEPAINSTKYKNRKLYNEQNTDLPDLYNDEDVNPPELESLLTNDNYWILNQDLFHFILWYYSTGPYIIRPLLNNENNIYRIAILWWLEIEFSKQAAGSQEKADGAQFDKKSFYKKYSKSNFDELRELYIANNQERSILDTDSNLNFDKTIEFLLQEELMIIEHDARVRFKDAKQIAAEARAADDRKPAAEAEDDRKPAAESKEPEPEPGNRQLGGSNDKSINKRYNNYRSILKTIIKYKT